LIAFVIRTLNGNSATKSQGFDLQAVSRSERNGHSGPKPPVWLYRTGYDRKTTMSRSKLQRFIGPTLLFVIVVLFYWKLVLTNQYTWLEGSDLAYLDLPWFQFQAGEWHHGRFPLWDPNGWFGQPLLAQAQPGAAYPFNWLLFLVPLKHGWIRQAALHWYFVLTRYLAALTCYALARDLGRSRMASILGGCVYALGGYVANTLAPQMVNGAVWTPLVLLYLLRAERGQRPLASSLLSGFFLGFGWLAGHHQMNLFVTIAAAGLWFWLCVRELKLNWHMARLAAVSLVMAAMTSAFQTVPTAEYGRRSVRWVGTDSPVEFNQAVPYFVHEDYSLKPISILGIFIPNLEYRSFTPYVGIVAFSLGILGAGLAWRERQVRWLAVMGLGGLIFALGSNSLFHGVIYSLVPLVEKARVPGSGTLVFAMGLSPLVAYGVDLLPRPEFGRWSRRTSWALIGVAAVTGTVAFIVFALKIEAATDDRLVINALAAALFAAILTGWRTSAIAVSAGTASVIGLILFELNNVSTSTFADETKPGQTKYLHRLAEHSDMIGFIRNQGEAARVEYDDNLIPYNIGDWYGVETFNSYTASATTNIWHMDLFSPRGKSFFGIKYYLGQKPPTDGLIEAFSARSGLKVFENPSAFPRVWSVHEARTVPDPKLVPLAMNEASFDARKTVLIGGPAPQLDSCNGSKDDVELPLHTPDYLRITASLGCRGMVILTDTWFPSWRATVDGKSAQIYQAYGGVRGVVVDAGQHTIEMRYRPWSVYIGAAFSVLAAAIALRASIHRYN
jgi:hypothetical protein